MSALVPKMMVCSRYVRAGTTLLNYNRRLACAETSWVSLSIRRLEELIEETEVE